MTKFKHDCEKCEFLGNLTVAASPSVSGPHEFDLYHCPQKNNRGGFVVARYGSGEDEQVSSIPGAVTRSKGDIKFLPAFQALSVAVNLAESFMLIEREKDPFGNIGEDFTSLYEHVPPEPQTISVEESLKIPA